MNKMRYIALLILITLLVVGCAVQQTTEPVTKPSEQITITEETASESEVLDELDSTYVADEEIDVGELY